MFLFLRAGVWILPSTKLAKRLVFDRARNRTLMQFQKSLKSIFDSKLLIWSHWRGISSPFCLPSRPSDICLWDYPFLPRKSYAELTSPHGLRLPHCGLGATDSSITWPKKKFRNLSAHSSHWSAFNQINESLPNYECYRYRGREIYRSIVSVFYGLVAIGDCCYFVTWSCNIMAAVTTLHGVKITHLSPFKDVTASGKSGKMPAKVSKIFYFERNILKTVLWSVVYRDAAPRRWTETLVFANTIRSSAGGPQKNWSNLFRASQGISGIRSCDNPAILNEMEAFLIHKTLLSHSRTAWPSRRPADRVLNRSSWRQEDRFGELVIPALRRRLLHPRLPGRMQRRRRLGGGRQREPLSVRDRPRGAGPRQEVPGARREPSWPVGAEPGVRADPSASPRRKCDAARRHGRRRAARWGAARGRVRTQVRDLGGAGERPVWRRASGAGAR